MVAGNIVRRLLARTMYQARLLKDVERATAPFQYALTMQSPSAQCIAHVGHSNSRFH